MLLSICISSHFGFLFRRWCRRTCGLYWDFHFLLHDMVVALPKNWVHFWRYKFALWAIIEKKILFVFSENYAEYNNSHVVPFEPKRSELRLYLPRVLFYSCSLSSHINRIISDYLSSIFLKQQPSIYKLFISKSSLLSCAHKK